LNLTRPGTNPAIHYYGLVRPEMQFRRSIQNLQNSLAGTQQTLGAMQAEMGTVSGTGHPIQFLNYGGYFMNYGPSAGTTGFMNYGLRSGTAAGAPPIPSGGQNFLPPSGGGPRR
jgi:hypothetical protein